MDYRNRHQYYSDLGSGAEDGFGASLRMVFLFGAIALGVSVLAAPFLQGAASQYAENRSFGVDHTLTGSVQKSERYTVRRSVLSQGPQTICENPRSAICREN